MYLLVNVLQWKLQWVVLVMMLLVVCCLGC